MDKWRLAVHEDHERVIGTVSNLARATQATIEPQDTWVMLRHLILKAGRVIAEHFRKEENVLFPAIVALIGEEARAIKRLQEDHRQLRAAVSYLLFLREGPMKIHEVVQAANSLLEKLKEHEYTENRLLLDVLGYSLEPRELMRLAGKYTHSSTSRRRTKVVRAA